MRRDVSPISCCAEAEQTGLWLMRLTTRIRSANDGWFALDVLELPELEAYAKAFEDIPDAVRRAAAAATGRDPGEFDVEVKL